MPTSAFNICCPRDCVSRHNGGTSGAPLKPLRVDSALRALSSLVLPLLIHAPTHPCPYSSMPLLIHAYPRQCEDRVVCIDELHAARNGGGRSAPQHSGGSATPAIKNFIWFQNKKYILKHNHTAFNLKRNRYSFHCAL